MIFRQPVFLIAANFVRSQWLVLAIMGAYLLGITGVFAMHQQRTEVAFFLQWHSFYVLFLGMMVAIPSLQNERKTRRIIAVLSKGIHRWEYLAGILSGCAVISGALCFLMAEITLWLCREGRYPTESIPTLLVALFACCVAAAAVGLFFSVFLHPLLATIASSVTLLLPWVVENSGWHPAPALFPIVALADALKAFHFQHVQGIWRIAAAALVYALVFLAAASAVFTRRDVTASPE
jgi:hypothetical protein